MDASRFDALAKTLGTSGSRRRLLQGLSAAVAAAFAGTVRERVALAGPRPDGCNGSGGTCQGKKSRPCCADSVCLANGKCCHSDAVCDGVNCYDLKNDPDNCGSCALRCADTVPTNAVVVGCSASVCLFGCAAGYHDCGGSCVPDTSIDSCGTSCSACPAPANGVATCDGSTCGATCDAGYASCDGDPSSPCETALDADPNCGECGNDCAATGETCVGGSCQCGSTGSPCGAGTVCYQGTCQAGCLIRGAYWTSGSDSPYRECRICDPAASTTTWTVQANGEPCADVGTCGAGYCSPCAAGGACQADGTCGGTHPAPETDYTKIESGESEGCWYYWYPDFAIQSYVTLFDGSAEAGNYVGICDGQNGCVGPVLLKR